MSSAGTPAGAIAGLLAREAVIDTLTTLFVATDDRAWAAVRGVLAPLEQVHHQIGNVRVHVDGRTADASCYGIAYHYRRHPSGRDTRVFVGHHDFRLQEDGGRWRITSMRFTARFVDGNATLERDD